MSLPSTSESRLPEPIMASPVGVDTAGPAKSGRARRSAVGWSLAVVATLAAAVLPAVAWPGEISWINDEPRLLARAYHANQASALADRGLVGHFGLSYGPAATQIYQLMLGVTHDPLTLARLRAALCAGLTALGLLWLARTLRLNPWFAAAVVLAPYLWVFQRILWDASFAIPIGTIAVASYAAFLRHGGGGPLLLVLACTLTLPFVHPQDLPLVAPILLHMVWRHRPSLWRNIGGVLVVTATVLLLNATYFLHLFAEISYYLTVGLPKRYPGEHSMVATYLGPVGLDGLAEWALSGLGLLQGPPTWPGRHLLGGRGFMGEDDASLSPLVRGGKAGLYVIYPLLWSGIAVAAWRAVRRPGRDRPRTGEDASLAPSLGITAGRGRGPHGSAPADVRVAVGAIALVGVLLQVLIAGATRVPAEPQYFFGTFVFHALLAWLAVDALSSVRLSHAAILAYGLSAAAVTLGTMWHYHRPAPGPPAATNPAKGMPTLGDSVAVVRALQRHPPGVAAVTDIDFYHRFPQALRALRLLVPPAAGHDGAPDVQGGPLLIRFRFPPDGSTPRVEVIQTASRSDVPGGARPINVSPLPAGWEPGQD